MIAEADRDGDGHVTFDEFFRVMSKKCNDPLNEFDSDEEADHHAKQTMIHN
jgi:Ca2+-binding EF-hand superfamily protein